MSTIKEFVMRLGEYLDSCRETDDHSAPVGEAESSLQDHTPNWKDSWGERETEWVTQDWARGLVRELHGDRRR